MTVADQWQPGPTPEDIAEAALRALEAQWGHGNGHGGGGAGSSGYESRSSGQGENEAEDDTEFGLIVGQAIERIIDGAEFLAGDSTIRAVWGHDNGDVLWAKDEPFLIVGPSGVGKSTLSQQVIKARQTGGDVLGYPVTGDDRKILILAMDRAAQIRRSMQRFYGENDQGLLRNLAIWRGPLPFPITRFPEGLATMADRLGVGTILADSLKDMAPNISKEETGSAINAAFQIAVNAGIDVGGLHHQRKAQGDNKKPTTLSDVYGSQMLVNGAGSVILLWGEAGDLVVELSHLKQPASQIGPLTVHHDHDLGETTVIDRPDAFDIVQGAHRGATARLVAARLYANTDPTANQVEKARRRLERLAGDGKIHREAGASGEPTTYYPLTRRA